MNKKELEQVIIQMDELKTRESNLKRQLKDCQDEIEKLNLSLINTLKSNNADLMTISVMNIPFSFGWDTKQRAAFDQTLFKEKEPELFEKYKTTKESKVFKFGVVKNRKD